MKFRTYGQRMVFYCLAMFQSCVYHLLGLVYLTFNWENSPDYTLFDDHDEILHEIVSFIDMSLRFGEVRIILVS